MLGLNWGNDAVEAIGARIRIDDRFDAGVLASDYIGQAAPLAGRDVVAVLHGIGAVGNSRELHSATAGTDQRGFEIAVIVAWISARYIFGGVAHAVSIVVPQAVHREIVSEAGVEEEIGLIHVWQPIVIGIGQHREEDIAAQSRPERAAQRASGEIGYHHVVEGGV